MTQFVRNGFWITDTSARARTLPDGYLGWFRRPPTSKAGLNDHPRMPRRRCGGFILGSRLRDRFLCPARCLLRERPRKCAQRYRLGCESRQVEQFARACPATAVTQPPFSSLSPIGFSTSCNRWSSPKRQPRARERRRFKGRKCYENSAGKSRHTCYRVRTLLHHSPFAKPKISGYASKAEIEDRPLWARPCSSGRRGSSKYPRSAAAAISTTVIMYVHRLYIKKSIVPHWFWCTDSGDVRNDSSIITTQF